MFYLFPFLGKLFRKLFPYYSTLSLHYAYRLTNWLRILMLLLLVNEISSELLFNYKSSKDFSVKSLYGNPHPTTTGLTLDKNSLFSIFTIALIVAGCRKACLI